MPRSDKAPEYYATFEIQHVRNAMIFKATQPKAHWA